MYDIIIVGAGPAGMTAAIYGSRAGKKVLVLEKKACGGQIINATKVKNYPGFLEISGLELSKNMRKQVESLGAEIKFEEVKKIVRTSCWRDMCRMFRRELLSRSDSSILNRIIF